MKTKIPHTYDEAFAILDAMLEKDKTLEMEAVICPHFTLGLWIRNNWIYPGGDEYLCDEPESEAGALMISADYESSDMISRYMEHRRQKLNL